MVTRDYSPINIPRGPWRDALSISSPATARKFLAREQEAWLWLNSEPAKTAPGKLWRRYLDWAPLALNAVQQWEDSGTDTELRNILATRYEQSGNLVASDLVALSLATLAEKSSRAAAIALSTYHGMEPIIDPTQLSQDEDLKVGRAVGRLLLSGWVSNAANAAKEAFKRSQTELGRTRDEFAEAVADTEKEADQLVAQTRQLFTQLEHEVSARHGQETEKRTEEFDRLKSNLEGLTAAYEARMELQAPVAYWRNKSNIHASMAKGYATALVIYAVSALVLLYVIFYFTASLLPNDPKDLSVALIFKISAISLLTTAVAFWIGRILLRNYVSDRHLYNDAQERRTMIMTFLALTRKKAVTDDDRKLILGALFRPASDGIVKEGKIGTRHRHRSLIG